MRKKISLFFVLVVILSGCGIGNKTKKDDTNIQTLKDTSFDGQVRDFNDVYKKTLIAIHNKQKDDAEKGMREVLGFWLEIEKKWLNNKPREYIITRSWEEKIGLISEMNKKTNELLLQGKYEEAYKQLEEVRIKIKQLREENRVKNISNNFLSLNDEVEKISKIENRDELIKNLPVLKIKFTEAREFLPDNQEYQNMMIIFSEIISDIENSTETTYEKNRDRLKPAFLEIYLKFG